MGNTSHKKRIEEITVRKAPKQSSGNIAGQIAGKTDTQHSAVHSDNVLDLRSIVAKKEVERLRKERLHHQEELQQQKKRIAAQKKQKLKIRNHSSNHSSNHNKEKESSLSLFKRTAPVHSTKKGLREEERTPEAAPAQSNRKKQHTKKQRTSFRESFWYRPLHDPELEKADPKTLPIYSFSFAEIGRPLLIFIVFAVMSILPAGVYATLTIAHSVQEELTLSAETAFTHLESAGNNIQQFNFTGAETDFQKALSSFRDAQNQLAELNSFIVSMAPYVPVKGKEFTAGQQLIIAGEEIALAGEQLSKTMGVLTDVDIRSLSEDDENGLTSLLVVVHSALYPATQHMSSAVHALNQVPLESVPEDKRDLVQTAQNMLPAVESTLQEGVDLTELLLTFLGHEEKKRYLVVFQNAHEMRPTGGFIGSLALIDLYQGDVQLVDIPGGGVYDVSGQLTDRVISPTPFHLVNPHWELQDANWFPHFPASAKKIEWFYERSGGDAVDGVISLIPRVVEQLLEITGPIDMTENFDVVIDKDNFYPEVQVRAEEKYDVTTESKKIISEMTPKLLNTLFDVAETPEGMLKILDVVQRSLTQKNILVYMNDPSLQEQFSGHDWSGELKQTDKDYLGIFHANIAGGKTDAVIEQTIKHQAQVLPDGSVVDTVSLTRIHKGSTDDPLANINNTDYVRFYLPEGSELMEAAGFYSPDEATFIEPDPGYALDTDLLALSGAVQHDKKTGVSKNGEFGKTVFGGWMLTPVGDSSTVTIRYKLPFKISIDDLWNSIDRYSLLVQKQPGSFGDFFMSELVLPDSMTVMRGFPEEYKGVVQTVLKEDLFIGAVIERKQ